MEEDFLIPIDDAIEAFRHYLDAHDRTILSERFGDGKSFFLSHFMEEDVTTYSEYLYNDTEDSWTVIDNSYMDSTSPVVEVQYFSVDGSEPSCPQRGINIVRMTKKGDSIKMEKHIY